jgi:hypothetical protein
MVIEIIGLWTSVEPVSDVRNCTPDVERQLVELVYVLYTVIEMHKKDTRC